jgi:hypothetical protein
LPWSTTRAGWGGPTHPPLYAPPGRAISPRLQDLVDPDFLRNRPLGVPGTAIRRSRLPTGARTDFGGRCTDDHSEIRSPRRSRPLGMSPRLPSPCLREDATDPELTSLERLALIPRSRTTDGRDPRDPQGPAGSRAKAPVSPRPPLPPERDPVKILSEDKLRAAIPLGNALRNSPPCVPAIGHLRMPRRANSHQFGASVASREGTLARVGS